LILLPLPPHSTLFPYTTLFRSDKFVYQLLTARGSSYENPPANFFRVTRNAKVSMEKTTQLFMGVRLVCTQCHDHPFEKWTQNQRSEEHTSELQSPYDLVCRLLL